MQEDFRQKRLPQSSSILRGSQPSGAVVDAQYTLLQVDRLFKQTVL